jgi:uncharacterized NAD(P)/FAD-binding protein YdhS
MDSASRYDVIIVGGGLAGTVLAGELARNAPADFRALVVGGHPAGPGTAYAPSSDRVYMNGPARAMSAVPSSKGDLVEWLGAGSEDALIERARYGRYLADRFAEAIAGRPNVKAASAEVVDAVATGDGWVVVDSAGHEYLGRAVVLAIGNFAPDDEFLPAALPAWSGFVSDPWRWRPESCEGDVLCIGSGLTAMDAIAMLDERGLEGRVHLVSRHGLLPCVEDPLATALDHRLLSLDTSSPYRLLRSLRAAARAFEATGGDWRRVVESIREITPAIWSGWSLRERRRFLRHLQAYWAVHRYRVPPPTAAVVERLQSQGRIVRHRGRVLSARRHGEHMLVELGLRGEGTTVDVSSAINCTGPNGNYARLRAPLVRNLVRRGSVRPDPLHLGLDANASFELLDRRGTPNQGLFAIGAPLRGLWFETTAVPETRDHAARLAERLIAEFAALRLSAAS